MSTQVLILSSLYDFSTDLVALLLQEAGVPCVRLNREQLAEYRLTLDPLTPELTIYGPSGTYNIGQDLVSVWFRQPVFLRNTPSAPLSPVEQLERSQWMAFLRGLCVFQNAAWMNFPPATYIAESKPYQLSIAKDCGFQVPATLATNDANQIRETFPDSLAVKSLDTVLLRDGDYDLFTYTILNPDTELVDEKVKIAPLFAQQALEEKTDLRVTVVGDQVFAVRILSQGFGISGDWRIVPKSKLEYSDVLLSEDIVECCKSLASRLNLSFAAIDLVETPQGIFFVEVNPTGGWGWLSTPQHPIDRAIASWLATPNKNSSKSSKL